MTLIGDWRGKMKKEIRVRLLVIKNKKTDNLK